jgi:carbon monoxide dehydrogenase subunit G
MLTFEGDRDFPLAPAPLWAKLRDASFLVECIPDGTVKGTPQRDEAQCSVKPGIAFLGGTMDVKIQIPEAVEPASVRILLSSKGIGTSSEVTVNLAIAAQGEASRIHYRAELAKLGGLLRAVPSGLIRGAAQKIIDEVWENVGRKLASGATP